MLITALNIKKGYGIQELFSIEKLEIAKGDRIGLIGVNGAGKSTLLKILEGTEKSDEGTIRRKCEIARIDQMGKSDGCADGQMLSRMQLKGSSCKSGGEKTRMAIAAAFSKDTRLLFADEPTTNLDVKGIRELEKLFQEYKGAFLLISHDRQLLEKVCTQIWEIDDKKLRCFPGNYSQWKEQKERERVQALSEYEKYQTEKHHIETAMYQVREEGSNILKRPRKMSNSEWQLYKNSADVKQKRVQGRGKVMGKRLEQLDVKEKPLELPNLNMRLGNEHPVEGKIPVSVKHLTIKYGEKVVLKNAELNIISNKCTVMMGANGAGKSSIIHQIVNGNPQVRLLPQVRIGYFSQEHETLTEDRSVLENVQITSNKKEHLIRTILANLNLSKQDIYKKVAVLSGGERAKVMLAKLLASDVNVLILDEPTNHIDIYTAEALESLLEKWEGTMLIVTHDRSLAAKMADRFLFVEDGKVTTFEGSWQQWEELQEKKHSQKSLNLDKTILSMRLAELSARLQRPRKGDKVQELREELDRMMAEYYK